MDLKRYGLEISIVIAKGCSLIVLISVENVKKSISILISTLKSYIERVIIRTGNQLYFM